MRILTLRLARIVSQESNGGCVTLLTTKKKASVIRHSYGTVQKLLKRAKMPGNELNSTKKLLKRENNKSKQMCQNEFIFGGNFWFILFF